MAEASTPTKTEPAEDEPKKKDAAAGGEPPHIVLRVSIGLAGLSLLVGFFLPWVNSPAAEGVAAASHAGYDIAMGQPFETPGQQILWALPALGVLLSATAFMGFRWAGQTAIGIAVAIFGFALYVVLRMFIERTELGLWVVAGGTFIVLLLGVIAWMVESRRKASKPLAANPKPADAALAD